MRRIRIAVATAAAAAALLAVPGAASAGQPAGADIWIEGSDIGDAAAEEGFCPPGKVCVGLPPAPTESVPAPQPTVTVTATPAPQPTATVTATQIGRAHV